jgi:hypothetical protein
MTEENESIELNAEIQGRIDAAAAWVNGLTVTNDEERETVINGLRGIKQQKNKVVAWFKPSREAAHTAWKAIVAQVKEVTDHLDKIERRAKMAILVYDEKVEADRKAEQARLQAVADKKARQEADRLRKEAEKLKTPELKEERIEQAEQVVAPVVQVAAPVKSKGVATRKTWKARIVNADEVPREYMTVNEKALNALAKATKGQIKVAGVEFFAESQLAVRV